MEGYSLHLSKSLIGKPKTFRPHHFSLPKESVVVAVEEIDKGTTTTQIEKNVLPDRTSEEETKATSRPSDASQ